MAEDRLKENQFDKVGVNPFNAPLKYLVQI